MSSRAGVQEAPDRVGCNPCGISIFFFLNRKIKDETFNTREGHSGTMLEVS